MTPFSAEGGGGAFGPPFPHHPDFVMMVPLPIDDEEDFRYQSAPRATATNAGRRSRSLIV